MSPDSTPSQYLLFRQLESTVTEELLSKGAAKLYKVAADGSSSLGATTKQSNSKITSTTAKSQFGAPENSLRRVLLVKDRRTGESWRYGFAEFATIDVSYPCPFAHNHSDRPLKDAQAALAKYNSVEKFTISSKPVLVSYAHAGVFMPVLDPSAGAQRYTFTSSVNPSLRLAYWDEEAYVSELVISSNDEQSTGIEHAVSGTSSAARHAEKEGLVQATTEQGDGRSTKKRRAEPGTEPSNKKVGPRC